MGETRPCGNPGCTNTFVARSYIHTFCSAKCRKAARGKEWGWVRETALARDAYQCQHCSVSGDGCRLECHHLTPVCMGGTSELGNLTTLCKTCHQAVHKSWRMWYGKRPA